MTIGVIKRLVIHVCGGCLVIFTWFYGSTVKDSLSVRLHTVVAY